MAHSKRFSGLTVAFPGTPGLEENDCSNSGAPGKCHALKAIAERATRQANG